MSTKQTEALKLALEALGWYDRERHQKAITAIREALAEQPHCDDCGGFDPECPLTKPAPVPKAHEQQEQHQDWCASLTQMLMSMPPRPAPCNCKQPSKPSYEELERIADDLQALCDKQAIRLGKLEAQQEPVAIEYWLQDTMESGRWVTTDNMAKATAEKMLSGEYGDVYPQGRIVEPSPPASKPWVGLTNAEKYALTDDVARKGIPVFEAICEAEAKLREKNA